jgi:hypothetical protein
VTRHDLSALAAGLVFGLGLALAQLTDRARVLGFLDVTGAWDPTLLFAMGGGVLTTVIAFRFVLRRPRPLLAPQFHLPSKTRVDAPLIIGAVLFGVGWGLAGYCPGAALASLTALTPNPALFCLAMIAGSRLARRARTG